MFYKIYFLFYFWYHFLFLSYNDTKEGFILRYHKNAIPRNVLACLCFLTTYLFINFSGNFWNTFFLLPFFVFAYVFTTENDKKTRGSAILSIGILLLTFFLTHLFTLIGLGDVNVIALQKATKIIFVLCNWSLIVLAIVSFFVVDKGSTKKDTTNS